MRTASNGAAMSTASRATPQRWALPIVNAGMAVLILASYNPLRGFVPVQFAAQPGGGIVTRAGSSARAAGVRPGSIVALAAMSSQARARLTGGTPYGAPELLALLERGRVRTVAVRADLRLPSGSPSELVLRAIIVVLSCLLIGVLGYRRPGIMTAALVLYEGVWVYSSHTLAQLPAMPDPLFHVLASIVDTISGPWAAAVLGSFVIHFPGDSPRAARRIAARIIDGCVIGLGLFDLLANTAGAPVDAIAFGGFCAVFVLAASITALRLADPQMRPRTVVVFAGVMLGGVLYEIFDLFLRLGSVSTALFVFGDLANLALPCCVSYAVLRHRIIDVGFVLNRTVVYTLTTTMLFVVIAALEFGIERFITGLTHIESTLVEFGVALAVIVGMRALHRRVDGAVDAVLFRKRHEAERAIRDFAEEAAYVTDRDTLLARAVATVEANADATFAEFIFDGGDDPAFVKLRAWRHVVDLRALDTALPGEAAYPMIARGRLLGALALGPKRTGEAYAPDESAAIAHLAQGVATALAGLERSDDARLTRIEALLESLPQRLARELRIDEATA